MNLRNWIEQNWTGIGVFKALDVKIIIRRPDEENHSGETLVTTDFIPIKDAVDMFGDYQISRLDAVLDHRKGTPGFQFTLIKEDVK